MYANLDYNSRYVSTSVDSKTFLKNRERDLGALNCAKIDCTEERTTGLNIKFYILIFI
jgi:hypothetical protein